MKIMDQDDLQCFLFQLEKLCFQRFLSWALLAVVDVALLNFWKSLAFPGLNILQEN